MIRNHHLAKSISDAGWNKIIQYTSYKAESAGKIVLLVDPRQTSQECSQCGNMKKDLNLSDRIYHCNACNLTIDRDLNAAINIERRGMQTLKEKKKEESKTEHVGRGTPEFTPVEIGSIPERANPVVETGSPRSSDVGGCHEIYYRR